MLQFCPENVEVRILEVTCSKDEVTYVQVILLDCSQDFVPGYLSAKCMFFPEVYLVPVLIAFQLTVIC
jgi:hypothetical protein